MKKFVVGLMLIGFAGAGFGEAGIAGMPSWPSELNGPFIPGLSPEAHADVNYSGEICSFGTECFEKRPIALQIYESLTQ